MAQSDERRTYTLTGFPANIRTAKSWREYISERQGVYDDLYKTLKDEWRTLDPKDRRRRMSRLDLIGEHVQRAKDELKRLPDGA